MPGAVVRHHLTVAQAQLMERYQEGLERAAIELARRHALRPRDIMFVLADRKGRIGGALAAALPVTSIGPVVLPGRARELDAWVARLALHGPVWDFSDGSTGIPVVVIDADDAMAVRRLGAGIAADAGTGQKSRHTT